MSVMRCAGVSNPRFSLDFSFFGTQRSRFRCETATQHTLDAFRVVCARVERARVLFVRVQSLECEIIACETKCTRHEDQDGEKTR